MGFSLNLHVGSRMDLIIAIYLTFNHGSVETLLCQIESFFIIKIKLKMHKQVHSCPICR